MRIERHHNDSGQLYAATIHREEIDKRPSNESHFFYQLKQLLQLSDSKWIKVNKVPGMNSIPYALRLGSNKSPKGFLYDNYYAIHDTAKTFWKDGKVYLDFWSCEELPMAVRIAPEEVTQ